MTSPEAAMTKKVRQEQAKEMMKLKDMELRKREIEEQIEKERRHLFGLQQLEQVIANVGRRLAMKAYGLVMSS